MYLNPSSSCAELGTAQPQLVHYCFHNIDYVQKDDHIDLVKLVDYFDFADLAYQRCYWR